MKTTFYLCILLTLIQFKISAQKGILEYKSGEKLEVEILLPKKFFGSIVDWYGMENSIHFVDLNSNESIKGKANDISFFEFEYNGVKKKYVSLLYQYNFLNKKLGKNLFGIVIEDGFIETLQIKGKRNSWVAENGPNRSSPGSWRTTNYKFLAFRKKTGEVFFSSFKFKKSWSEFTSDCPSVSEKVSNGQYSVIKYREIVRDYNSSCGNSK
ncbi:hypothetical protein EGI22_01920 [Lacihabitans sp. LS3-19]|uniref:hypothetical protein n=1 Tax=Lacihabitans sp. LS3-19 TaxID=2487335 RepID=UPI0020CBE6D1|nr:hypothetical protein [Lacihabitans sp. LS3-19]MCP9766647.1 hypothetical protein [Lacihabitans sp. LS3-19]